MTPVFLYKAFLVLVEALRNDVSVRAAYILMAKLRSARLTRGMLMKYKPQAWHEKGQS